MLGLLRSVFIGVDATTCLAFLIAVFATDSFFAGVLHCFFDALCAVSVSAGAAGCAGAVAAGSLLRASMRCSVTSTVSRASLVASFGSEVMVEA